MRKPPLLHGRSAGRCRVTTRWRSCPAGRRAKANHTGAFVWADSKDADFASTGTNQFNVRATGGVRLETRGAGATLDGQSPVTTASAVGDAQLSANVALLGRPAQTFTGTNIFTQRVGIGTSASTSTLRVQGAGSLGDLWLSPTTSGGNADIFLSETTSGSFGIILRHNGTSNTLDFVGVNSSVETTEPVVSMGRGNTSGMHVRNALTVGGNVGIGTNNPSARLHIGGVPGTDGIQFPDGSVQVRAAKVIRYTTPSEWPIQALAPGAATAYSFSISGVQMGSVVVVSPLTDLGAAIALGQARVSSPDNVSFTCKTSQMRLMTHQIPASLLRFLNDCRKALPPIAFQNWP